MTDRDSLFDARIEKVIRDSYERFHSRVVTGEERIAGLLAKLHEEVAEVVDARDSGIAHAFIEELGDVVEVCYALGGYDAVEGTRLSKKADLGGFERGLVMRLADRTDKPETDAARRERMLEQGLIGPVDPWEAR